MESMLNNRHLKIRPLGSGGFSQTFLGRDTHYDRPCVIKQLKPANDPEIYKLYERFKSEAKVLKELGEINGQIPECYDDFSAGGDFYLVQEWIEGKSLKEKLQEGEEFSEIAVKTLLCSLLSVLDVVHSHHIIHRDITPSNIIIREPDHKPVLIDFGAVKEAASNDVTTIVIGKQDFMPVEQAQGRPVYASDLYSLGLTAICLLTRKNPKELTDPRTGEIKWYRHTTNVSRSMAEILNKAIETFAHNRYQTAREMRDALLNMPQAKAERPLPPSQPVKSKPQSKPKPPLAYPTEIYIKRADYNPQRANYNSQPDGSFRDIFADLFGGQTQHDVKTLHKDVQFPSKCAYCCQSPVADYIEINTELKIPYCARHARIINTYKVLIGLAIAMGIVVTILTFSFVGRNGFIFGNTDYIFVAALIIPLVAVGLFYFPLMLMFPLFFPQAKNLSEKGAVWISNVYTNAYVLQFLNKTFADEFARLNRDILVNPTYAQPPVTPSQRNERQAKKSDQKGHQHGAQGIKHEDLRASELKRLQKELNDLTQKPLKSEKFIMDARNKYRGKDTLEIYKVVIRDYTAALSDAQKDLANLTLGDPNVRVRLLNGARIKHPEEDELEVYRIVIDQLRRGR